MEFRRLDGIERLEVKDKKCSIDVFWQERELHVINV